MAAFLVGVQFLFMSEQVLSAEEDLPEGIEGGGEDPLFSAEQLQALHIKLDKDSDGKISMVEALAFASASRKKQASHDIASLADELDADKDGKVSLDEHINEIRKGGDKGDLEEMQELEEREEHETAKHAAADFDGDGLLDHNELQTLLFPETSEQVFRLEVAAAMRQKDEDRNGKLSEKEFWGLLGGPEVEESDMEISDAEFKDFAALDKDGDMTIDLDELYPWESGEFHTRKAASELFRLADKDWDFHLTAAELIGARTRLPDTDASFQVNEWMMLYGL